MYKYKITEDISNVKRFQTERIEAFDELENRLQDLKKYIRQSKLATIRYYNENPDSYAVVKGTDLASEYFDDIETLLKEE
jgi:hypothetical protein